jgi:hypothetical protein
VVAAFVAWTALIAMIWVSIAHQPHDPNSDNGCLDICIAPPAWFVLDLLLTPIVAIKALVGLGTSGLARNARPDGLGRGRGARHSPRSRAS